MYLISMAAYQTHRCDAIALGHGGERIPLFIQKYSTTSGKVEDF